jgi:UDP-N-acetylglucosamine 2-epimerase (non-hydrolysing)
MKVVSVVGARPNFVKMAPVISQLERRLPSGSHVLVHTGQHYDRLLSDVFLEELGVRSPDHLLEVGSGTHAEQTARVMERLEPVLVAERPELLIVAGDVNSTLAAALVAAKLHIPIAHVESGLRSFDRSMPEEINRVLTDQVSDFLFVHSAEAVENLHREGVADSQIHFVGNTMIDSLVAVEQRVRSLGMAERLGLPTHGYLLVTLHRPALVDGPLLEVVLERLAEVARELPVVLPAHPRTALAMKGLSLEPSPDITITEPLSYLNFLSLEADAAAVLTDSGGVQEETTYLGVPCFTLRATTERPVTITVGTNELLGLDPDRIAEIPGRLSQNGLTGGQPALWDGRAAERLVDLLLSAALPVPVAG